MTALGQTFTSLRHRPGRAFLTALGTALGIGTIVALLAVSAGATQTAGRFVHLGRSDRRATTEPDLIVRRGRHRAGRRQALGIPEPHGPPVGGAARWVA